MQPNNYIKQDQARGLREMNNAQSKVKVIAVTGGKGGVGKTSVSINLALSLANTGKRVLILDADLGLANVDVMLGLRSGKNLSHVLAGDATLDEIIVYGPGGIGIIPATSGIQNMTELSITQHAGLINAFNGLKAQFDVLLVDTAAGISDMVLCFSRAAQDVVVVVCDEPSSITDAYALIKILNNEFDVYKFKIVANMVRQLSDGLQLFSKLTKVTDKFLNVSLELVATIPFDENLRKSVRKQTLIVESFPNSPASVAYKGFANKVKSWSIPEQSSGHLSFFIEQIGTGSGNKRGSQGA